MAYSVFPNRLNKAELQDAADGTKVEVRIRKRLDNDRLDAGNVFLATIEHTYDRQQGELILHSLSPWQNSFSITFGAFADNGLYYLGSHRLEIRLF